MLKWLLIVILGMLSWLYTTFFGASEPPQARVSEPSTASSEASSSSHLEWAAKAYEHIEPQLPLSIKPVRMPLPGSGCLATAVTPESLEQALNEAQASVPAPQLQQLRELIEALSPLLTTSLYVGPAGYGLCLPHYRTLLLLPASDDGTRQ